MQISDLQDTKTTNVDTLNFVDNALEKFHPDLIVFTGDQLDVFGLWGKGEKCRANVEKAIRQLFSAVEKHNIPYVVTFGNHDRETGISNAEQAKIYASLGNCICFDNLNDGRPDAGTFNVEILSSDESRTALNLYVFDSQSKLKIGSYDKVKPEQIEWYKRTSEELKNKNSGNPVPSMVFQHIPVFEIYDVLKKVPKGTKGALPAHNNHKNEYYVLDESKIIYGGKFGETPASPNENGGQFEAIKEQGDVFAMYFGHDHYNSFIGKVDGIDLGYCPGAGFNVYGIYGHGMRVFDFDENDVKGYKTFVVGYKDVCDKFYVQPLKNIAFSLIPSSPHDVPDFAKKTLPICFALLAIVILLYIFVSQKLVLTTIGSIIGACALYGIFALVRNITLRKKLLKRFMK